MESARVLYEVRAGLIPGTPDLELSRKWAVTSKEYEEQGYGVVLERYAVAKAYCDKLAIDCMSGLTCNWVELTFVWL